MKWFNFSANKVQTPVSKINPAASPTGTSTDTDPQSLSQDESLEQLCEYGAAYTIRDLQSSPIMIFEFDEPINEGLSAGWLSIEAAIDELASGLEPKSNGLSSELSSGLPSGLPNGLPSELAIELPIE